MPSESLTLAIRISFQVKTETGGPTGHDIWGMAFGSFRPRGKQRERSAHESGES